MPKTAQGSRKTASRATTSQTRCPVTSGHVRESPTLSTAELKRAATQWKYDSEGRQLSPLTIAENDRCVQRLLWFIHEGGYDDCDVAVLRAYLAYISTGHTLPGGRWGRAHKTTKVKARTVRNAWAILRTFFRWMVRQDLLDVSPLECVTAPIARSEQARAFSEADIMALLRAADRSLHRIETASLFCCFLTPGYALPNYARCA